jgi:hypothetical protein
MRDDLTRFLKSICRAGGWLNWPLLLLADFASYEPKNMRMTNKMRLLSFAIPVISLHSKDMATANWSNCPTSGITIGTSVGTRLL